MEKKFLIGCNYWDSVSGTDMWKNWNPEEVQKDLDVMQSYGVKCLRVFPMWRDFQPVRKLYSCCGSLGEYVLGEQEKDITGDDFALDPVMIERFKTFAGWAKDRGMTLVVAIVTGWMSGRLFTPPAIEGKNLINDPEALMWMEKFIRGIVAEFKDIENIVMWDLGNECNNLSPAKSRYEAYMWTSIVRNAILSVDNTRQISSGMHGLSCDGGCWLIQDQGSLCDYLTTHPYPSPSIGADTEPYNSLKPTIMPTAQSEFYSGISGKPVIIQEQGTFSQTIGNDDMSADFMRVNVLSALANGFKGYLWWCAMDHTHLRKAPYTWTNMERTLGLVGPNRSYKPVADVMKNMSALIGKLPDQFEKQYDAVCVLSREIKKYDVAVGCYTLAKEAGFNAKIQDDSQIIDDADLYLLPCVGGWAVTHTRTLDKLLDRVENHGATLFVSFDGGHFNEFEKIFGVRSNGFDVRCNNHIADFGFGEIKYEVYNEVLLSPLTAKVLATNENGNPVLTVNVYGKGKIYLLNFPLETNAFRTPYALNPQKAQPYYKFYQIFANEKVENYGVENNANVGVTKCKGSDGKDYLFLVNYSNESQEVVLSEEVNSKYQVVYGDKKVISACDALILKS